MGIASSVLRPWHDEPARRASGRFGAPPGRKPQANRLPARRAQRRSRGHDVDGELRRQVASIAPAVAPWLADLRRWSASIAAATTTAAAIALLRCTIHPAV